MIMNGKSLLLLTDPDGCPSCGHKHTINWDLRICRNCQTRLMKPSDNFALLKRIWLISFWVYFPLNSSGFFRGWTRSEHLDDPNPIYEFKLPEKPPEDYGRKSRLPGGSNEYKPDALGVETLKDKTTV